MPDVNTAFYPQAQPANMLTMMGEAQGLGNAVQQNQLLRTANQQTHQDLVKQQVGALIDGFSSLATNPDVGYDDFVRVGSTLLKQGVIDQNTYNAELANLPKQAAPQVYHSIANGYISRAMDAGQRFSAEYGFTPGAGATPTDVVNPNGSTTRMPLGAFAGAAGAGTPLGGGMNIGVPSGGQPNPLQANPESGPPANPFVAGGGHPPAVADRAADIRASLAGAPAAAAPVPLAQPKAGSPGFTGPSPQEQKQFEASAQQQQDDLNADAGYTANIVPLTKTLDLLPKTPLFGSGAEVPTQVAKVLNTFGIKVGSDQAQNASELDKYLTQLARASGAAPNSDSQLAAAFSANPNMTTDKAAAQDVVKTMLSLNRMQHAKVAAAQAAGVAPEQYSTFASQWGGQQDPRAYGFDLMDDKAKAALRKQLDGDKAAAAKFVNSYKTAVQLGVLGQ